MENAPVYAPPNPQLNPLIEINPNSDIRRRRQIARVPAILVAVLPSCPFKATIPSKGKIWLEKLRDNVQEIAVIFDGDGPFLLRSLREDVCWRRLGLREGWICLRSPCVLRCGSPIAWIRMLGQGRNSGVGGDSQHSSSTVGGAQIWVAAVSGSLWVGSPSIAAGPVRLLHGCVFRGRMVPVNPSWLRPR